VSKAVDLHARPRLARGILAAGIVLIAGGVAHLAGVMHHYATAGAPAPRHVVYDLFIGYFHLGAGALDVLASYGVSRGEPWAKPVLAIASALVVAFGATVSPVVVHAPVIFRVMPIVYPLVHIALFGALMRGRSRVSTE
jgi:hypothetical protein